MEYIEAKSLCKLQYVTLKPFPCPNLWMAEEKLTLLDSGRKMYDVEKGSLICCPRFGFGEPYCEARYKITMHDGKVVIQCSWNCSEFTIEVVNFEFEGGRWRKREGWKSDD